MHLVQILLPLADNKGEKFPQAVLEGIRSELCERFGGLTAYSRSPARGVWRSDGSELEDDIVIVEVMTEALDEGWWHRFRIRLEGQLRQESLVIRAQEMRQL